MRDAPPSPVSGLSDFARVGRLMSSRLPHASLYSQLARPRALSESLPLAALLYHGFTSGRGRLYDGNRGILTRDRLSGVQRVTYVEISKLVVTSPEDREGKKVF